jgi:hypothetical protein
MIKLDVDERTTSQLFEHIIKAATRQEMIEIEAVLRDNPLRYIEIWRVPEDFDMSIEIPEHVLVVKPLSVKFI